MFVLTQGNESQTSQRYNKTNFGDKTKTALDIQVNTMQFNFHDDDGDRGKEVPIMDIKFTTHKINRMIE